LSTRLALRQRPWWPLVAVLAGGLVVRLFATVAFSTTVLNWTDSGRFARIAPYAPLTGMFDDPWMPAGYPLFLRGVHELSNALWVTVALQHVLGLGTAGLLYATLRRLDASRGLALVPAAVVALGGDFIYMEHALLNEWLTVLLLAAGAYLTVRGAATPRSRRWLIGAGMVLGCAAIVRNTALIAAVAAFAWLTFMRRGEPRTQRLKQGVLLLSPAAFVVGGYVALATTLGSYAGMSDIPGWFLYGRTAPFANCSEFTPKRELRVLCENSPPGQRRGPFFYVNFAAGPGRQNFDLLPFACATKSPSRHCNDTQQKKVGEFARQAIIHQPLSYLRAVLKDFIRYVEPGVGRRRTEAGSEAETSSFGYDDPIQESALAADLRKRYRAIRVEKEPGRSVLKSYQALLRVNGIMLLAAAGLTVAGLARGNGPSRVVPVAVFTYDYRYGLIPQAFLIAAAALGASALLERHRVARMTSRARA
jgi:hypothetical protein